MFSLSLDVRVQPAHDAVVIDTAAEDQSYRCIFFGRSDTEPIARIGNECELTNVRIRKHGKQLVVADHIFALASALYDRGRLYGAGDLDAEPAAGIYQLHHV